MIILIISCFITDIISCRTKIMLELAKGTLLYEIDTQLCHFSIINKHGREKKMLFLCSYLSKKKRCYKLFFLIQSPTINHIVAIIKNK